MSVADMITTVATGSPTAVGGSSPKAVEFAQNICTKLGACAGMESQISQQPTGRGR